MSFVDIPKETVWEVIRGKDLILQARISRKICLQFNTEVRILQHELDAVMSKFNKGIKELQAERKSGFSEEQKAVLSKMNEGKVEEGGGIQL